MKPKVLITGASRGIGRSIAIELASQGFEVILNYKSNQTQAEQTYGMIQKEGGASQLLQFDVSDRQECVKTIQTFIEKQGSFYGVVCNAGITSDSPFPSMSEEAWDTVIHTNLDSFFNVLQPTIMPMVLAKQGGRIVTLSSISGIMGNRGQVNYSATKAGIIGATKSLAQELAKRKICVNCVAPGLIETDMIKDLSHQDAIMKQIPMRRLGKPDEVAALVGFLFSEKAAYITGQVISINGGMI